MQEKKMYTLFVFLSFFLFTSTLAQPYTQYGSKLVGTGYVGPTVRQGISVATSANGNVVAVGGSYDNTGIGATWVFERTTIGGPWVQVGSKLLGNDMENPYSANVFQGNSVSLSDDGTILASGAPLDNNDYGAVWMYIRNSSGGWNQFGPKLSSDESEFGYTVALSSNGSILGIGAAGLGVSYIFERNSTGYWNQQGPMLVGSNDMYTQQGYGIAISSDGTTFAVSGWSYNSNVGALYIFIRYPNGTWAQQGDKLVPTGYSSPPRLGYRGISMSADGNTVAATGVADTPYGSVWVFTRDAFGVWSQQGNKITRTTAYANSYFGLSVSLSTYTGDLLAIGDSNNGNSITGMIWIYSRTDSNWTLIEGPIIGSSGNTSSMGTSVALSRDTSVLVAGGSLDNSGIGATWIFNSPTSTPTQNPTTSPSTSKPSSNPTTSKPSVRPTRSPTHSPSKSPTHSPTVSPTQFPTSHTVSTSPTVPSSATQLDPIGYYPLVLFFIVIWLI
jgi:hypothetical protein